MRFTHFIISRRADEWIVLYEASLTGLLNWRSKAFERVLFFLCLQLIYFGRRFAAEPNVGTSPTYIFVLWTWNTKKAGNNTGFHHPISQWSQALSAATGYSWARNPAWTHTSGPAQQALVMEPASSSESGLFFPPLSTASPAKGRPPDQWPHLVTGCREHFRN